MSDAAGADRELGALASLLETEREPLLGILMEQIRSFPDSRFECLLDLVPPTSPVLPQLELDIHGVALPGHFIACLRAGSDPLYFDPFREGVLLSLREVMSIVTGTGTAFRPEHLRPPTAPEILRRMLSNLEAAYGRRHDP